MRGTLLLALLGLAACNITRPPPVSSYAGTLTPTNPGPACQSSPSTLRITADRVIFAPNDGTWTLNGTATPSGTITAERDTRGVDRKPYITELAARYDANTVSGTYTTPSCTFTVQLARI